MLDRLISSIGIIILGLFLLIVCINVTGYFAQWYRLQGQAQAVANIMARYGQYTSTAQQTLDQLCQRTNMDQSKLTVTTKPAQGAEPAVYGEEISVTLVYPYEKSTGLKGKVTVIRSDIKATGTAVSRYQPGINVYGY